MDFELRMPPALCKTFVKDGILVMAQAKILLLLGENAAPTCKQTSFSIIPRKQGIIEPQYMNELVKLFYNLSLPPDAPLLLLTRLL